MLVKYFHIYAKPLHLIRWYMFFGILIWLILALALKKRIVWTSINRIGVVISTLLVFYMTIYGRSSSARGVDLIPLKHLFGVEYHSEYFRTLHMNVFLFFPLGLSLPYAFDCSVNRKYLKTILTAFFLSLCIECIQYLGGLGLAELDDLLMNTLGAGIGAISYVIFSIIKKEPRNG